MKIGIEIHQRLDTHKLFCNCPSLIMEPGKEPDLSIMRELHPVFSELGEVDRASTAEFSRDRRFNYQAFRESNCLVEMDEEPPHQLSPGALAIALEIAAALKAKPVDEIHVMRKVVIDGSNTSGFQRTAIVAMDGSMDTSKGKVGIPLVALEEESAGIVKTAAHEATYRLDRLGIPLVEISTTPDIKDGQHLREVAEKLGLVLRATGKVARGLGTIRQDVNISIEGGARVEIKGAQDLKTLPKLAESEVRRQKALLEIIAELKKRFNGKVSLDKSFFNVSQVFRNTKSQFISKALKAGSLAYAMLLPKHGGLLGREIQFNRRYGSELSDYAKPAGVKGIIHSDENLSKYGISPKEAGDLAGELGMGKNDAFVLVLAPMDRAKAALARVADRALVDYVPEETRRANPDSSSSYMRPLPGKARLYPETDIVPIPVTKALLSAVKKKSGESLGEKKEKLMSQLSPEMAEKMLRSRNLALYEKYVKLGVEPTVVATTLENTLVSLRREGVALKEAGKVLDEVFREYLAGTFVKSAIPDIIRWAATGMDVKTIAKEKGLSRITGNELKKIAKEHGYDMRRIMQAYRFRVDAKELGGLLKKKK